MVDDGESYELYDNTSDHEKSAAKSTIKQKTVEKESIPIKKEESLIPKPKKKSSTKGVD